MTVAEMNRGISLAGERVVVVGGTQGIGERVACRFAEAGAEVWIVGRNETMASGVLTELEKISTEQKIDPAPNHTFLKSDLSLVSEAKRVAGDIRARAGKQGIDYLVMSQGGPPNGKFVVTSEGHEKHYAVQVLSRFIVSHELAGNPASSIVKQGVMAIMAPGKGYGAFDADDIDLRQTNAKGKYGILTAMTRASVVVDSFTDDHAKANPNVTFTHVFPGVVKTAAARNSELPWYFQLMSSVIQPVLGTSPQKYAEIPFYLLAHPEGKKLAARDTFLSEKLAKIEHHPSFDDENVREKIRSHLLKITNSEK